MKKLLLVALSCLLTTAFVPECGPGRPHRLVSLGQVTITSYQAAVNQTDGNPFITADGTDLRETDERICAVSQDMLWYNGGLIRWGDEVWLSVAGLSGPWTVRDTMAATVFRDGKEVPLTRHVDLLTETYGKWVGYALLVRRGQ